MKRGTAEVEMSTTKYTKVSNMSDIEKKKVGEVNKIATSTVKKHSASLSKTKLVYARDGFDESENFVIREFYPDSKFTAFGVTGVEKVRNVFYSILYIMNTKREELIARVKYGTSNIEGMLNALPIDVSLNNESFADNVELVDELVDDGGVNIYAQFDRIKVCLRFKKDQELAQFSFYNIKQFREDENGDKKATIDTGIYLFPSEVFKLMKYLNNRFDFVECDQLKYNSSALVSQYATDDFF